MNVEELIEFTKKFYESKDLMHNHTHIERILKMVDILAEYIEIDYNKEKLIYGAYFHGCIKNNEREIRKWLLNKKANNIEHIIEITKESLKENEAKSIEGKLLHDAHMIEGGKYFLLIKSLITGSLRGQALDETIYYFENNVLNFGLCYIPEAQGLLEKAREEANKVLKDLKEYI